MSFIKHKNNHKVNNDKKYAFTNGWKQFFLAELEIIRKRRSRLKKTSKCNSSIEDKTNTIYARDDLDNTPYTLVGLSLSGGGIRSCLFNLGVLQELSRLGLLKIVDILSTVSGGGYIGGCLASLLSLKKPAHGHEPLVDQEVFTFSKGDEPLFDTDWDKFPFRDWAPAGFNHSKKDHNDRCKCPHLHWTTTFSPKREMKHLRSHSNFLLPAGFNLFESFRSWGASTLHLMAPMLWFLCLITMIMLAYMTGLQYLFNVTHSSFSLSSYELDVVRAFLATNLKAAFHCITINPWIFIVAINVFFGLGCVFIYRPLFKGDGCEIHNFGRPKIKGVFTFCIFLLITLQVLFFASFNSDCLGGKAETNVIFFLFEPFYFSLACLFAVFLCLWFKALFSSFERIHLRSFLYIMAGISMTMTGATFLMAILPLLIKTVHLLLYALFQLIFAAGARYLIGSMHQKEKVASPGDLVMRTQGLLLNILVVIIVTLFLLLVGHALDRMIWENNWLAIDQPLDIKIIGIGISLITLFLFLSLTDFNKVSAHYFYGDRLAEAFLQTSRPRSQDDGPDPRAEILRKTTAMNLLDLHGRVSGESDSHAKAVAAYGPYYIISATLNLTAAYDLQGLKRRTEPFWFSRLFVGSDRTGYANTSLYCDLELVRALTISGAAVSPVMGIYTNRLASFACCLLGVRLGFWLTNPRCFLEKKSRDNSSTPRSRKKFNSIMKKLWITRLLREFTGNVNATGDYIYLSDGGHCGDNLGIVPLLRRRVKLIIASDAECDPLFAFNSLNSSLRSIYVDDGIKIDLNIPQDFMPNEEGFSARHFLVGRILYPDRPWQASWIIVLKSSLTGDELAPILNYKRKSPEFPHETTANQFFTEEQFESYRALGRHIINTTFSEAVDIANMRRLDQAWENIDTLCRHLYLKTGHGLKSGLYHKWDDLFTALWDTDEIETSPGHWHEFQEKIADFAQEAQDAFEVSKTKFSIIPDSLIRQLLELDAWLKKIGILDKLVKNGDEIPKDYRGFQMLKHKYGRGGQI